ncbi:MAG: 6-phosphofructokinase [Cryomorphaceae bacterium]
MSDIKKIAVFTSGGDAPGMNAAVRAVVRSCIFNNIQVAGIFRGYQGLIEGDIEELTARSVNHILQRGGTVLKSARSDDFRKPEGRAKAHEKLKSNGVDALVAIGGDGTFTGAFHFNKEFDFPVIGIPGTIDNDLFGTDYTIGFDTALNTVIDAVDKIRDTAASHSRLFFVEVMGRDAGFIAAHAGLASGALAVMIPEREMTIEQLLDRLNEAKRHNKSSSIVIVAEGGKSGNATEIAAEVSKQMPFYETKVTILGHIQRGGSPSCFDRNLASRLGVAAVEALLKGKRDAMVGMVHHKVVLTPFEKAISDKFRLDSEIVRISDILSI